MKWLCDLHGWPIYEIKLTDWEKIKFRDPERAEMLIKELRDEVRAEKPHFENHIRAVSSMTGATQEESEALSKKARDLGGSNKRYAIEAAKRMEILANIGLNVEQILENEYLGSNEFYLLYCGYWG